MSYAETHKLLADWGKGKSSVTHLLTAVVRVLHFHCSPLGAGRPWAGASPCVIRKNIEYAICFWTSHHDGTGKLNLRPSSSWLVCAETLGPVSALPALLQQYGSYARRNSVLNVKQLHCSTGLVVY